MARAVLVVGLALSVVLVAPARSTSSGEPRVMVLGLDGVDPDVVHLLIGEGRLPNFARLEEGGAFGPLRSSEPMLSPILWTTMATGRLPTDHGIGYFTAANPETGEELPVTSQMRRVQSIWNIASDAGRRVGVVGWWATWPAERVNGTIVSDHVCYHFLQGDRDGGRDEHTVGLIHPPARQSEIERLVRRPSDVTPEEAARFVDVPAEEFDRPFDFKDDLSHFRWALATADSYRRIGLHLWETDRPDLLLTYVEGVDSTSHLFGHLFRVEGLAGELAIQQGRYGKVVERMYEYADGMVGDFLAALDERTTLVVLSDHGFELGKLPEDPRAARDMRRATAKYHRIDGVLYLYGRGIRPGRITGATQLDVTPTVLTLLGISPARDMPGGVLADALVDPVPERTVASYERNESETTRAAAHDPHVDPTVLEHLRALGYLDAESPGGDQNLAALLFKEGRYPEAAEMLRKLVEAEPESSTVRTSYAAALTKLGRGDEALAQLDEAVRLAPGNAQAHYNRGVIFEKRGKRAEAIAAHRTALRYRPGYEPSRARLAALGVRPTAPASLTPTQQRAWRMAVHAKELAQRGNYENAMRVLDEAVRIAPRLPPIHHYRYSVAYLMGDVATARAELERALVLNPDDVFARKNLERLDAKRQAGADTAPRQRTPAP